ncbi:MAG TPA: hypothetical protein VFV34_28615, partial [Blastocatellia bacterium]|nr:hypothetical protein [Blastocatellia bacterium]
SKLALIARENIEHIDEMIRLQDQLSEQWEGLLAEPTELVQALVQLLNSRLSSDALPVPYPSFVEDYVDQRVREILAASDSEGGEGIVRNEAQPRPADGLPPGGRESAASILVEAGERAVREGRLRSGEQIETGRTRYLVSPKSIHMNGKPFFSPRSLSNGLFVETHCSIQTARRQAEILNAWNRERPRERR